MFNLSLNYESFKEDASHCFQVIGMVHWLDKWINTRVICSRLQETKKIDSQVHKRAHTHPHKKNPIQTNKQINQNKQNNPLNQLYKTGKGNNCSDLKRHSNKKK